MFEICFILPFEHVYKIDFTMLLLLILHISHFNYFNPGGYVVVVRKIQCDRELFGFKSETTDF